MNQFKYEDGSVVVIITSGAWPFTKHKNHNTAINITKLPAQ